MTPSKLHKCTFFCSKNMIVASKSIQFLLHNLAWILLKSATFANQKFMKISDKFDDMVIEYYGPPDDDDSFKKRGEAFENQYIRKLDYDLTKKLRQRRQEARKEEIRRQMEAEREKLFKEEHIRQEESANEELSRRLTNENKDDEK